MKALICLILAFAMVFTLTACGGLDAPAATNATESIVEIAEAAAPETTEAEPVTEAATEASVPGETDAPITVYEARENTVLDNEACTFSVGKIAVNELAGMQVEVTCTNKTQESLDFSWNDVSVCGLMYDPAWAVTVAAGETVTSQVEIDTYALETMGIQAADEITFLLRVASVENWMDAPYAEQTFTIYPTGLDSESVIYPVREPVASEVVLVDDEALTFIIEYVEQQALSYTVRCYAVNKTQEPMLVSWENVAVNGLAADPFWAAPIAAGKAVYSQVKFDNAELQGLGIEAVEEITFDLMCYDGIDWTELTKLPVSYQPVEEVALG